MGGTEPENETVVGHSAVLVPYADAAALLVRRAEAVAASAGPGPVWLGIDGLGASGKTTLADQVVRGLVARGLRVALVSVDDFARPVLDRWDHARFTAQLLQPLVRGRDARYQRWDHLADRGLDWVDVAAGCDVVVVEGVSCTDVAVAVPWDVRVWVDASPELRMQRILRRDGPELLDVWLTDWIPNEEAYVAEQDPRSRAHVVVTTPPTCQQLRRI